MMFSVVIPVHNGEQFIEECLESAVEQVKGIDGAEIIIVENGSTDRTAEICDRICAGETCIRVIHEGAIGLYLARQVGIKASKGDYILALDSDDRLMDGMLGRLNKHDIDACVVAGHFVNGIHEPDVTHVFVLFGGSLYKREARSCTSKDD